MEQRQCMNLNLNMSQASLDDVRILVTGAGGPAGYSVLERLKEILPSATILAADACPYSSGLFVVPRARRHVIPLATAPDFVDAVATICRTHSVDLLIPTVDAELISLAWKRSAFLRFGTRIAVAASQAIEQCLDKIRLTDALRGVIPTAPTVPWSGQELEGWRFPIVAKPRRGSGSRGIVVAHERSQLLAVPTDGSYLVMPFLPGPEYSVDVFRTTGGDILASVPRERLRVDSGVAIASRTLHDSQLERFAALAVQAMGLTGVANVQFRRDAHGVPMLLEINPRFPGTIPLTIAAGADMPLWCVQDAMGVLPPSERVDFTEVAVVRRWKQQFLSSEELGDGKLVGQSDRSGNASFSDIEGPARPRISDGAQASSIRAG